jgi:hypothetical protein
MIQSRRASSWQSYWEMRGGQREREKKEDLLRRRGATSVQEGGASKIFLPSFLFLRLEKHKTHAHTYKMDWWFDSMISSYSFASLLLLLPLLLLLFLFHDGWSSRHLCSVSYFAGNFISNNFWNIFVVVVGLVCLSAAQLLISSRRTYTPSKVAYIYCFVELLFSLSLVRFPTVTVGGEKSFFGIERRSINNHLRSTHCCTIKPCRLVSCSFFIHKRLAIFGFDLLPLP